MNKSPAVPIAQGTPRVDALYVERLELTIEQLRMEVAALSAQVVELQKDAKRYKWMRQNWAYAHGTIFFDGFVLGPLATLDEAIDEAKSRS